ncbi:3 beta-hydroxysteroid dehydrogenase/Delta 5--_4-isomerase type 1 [Galendromus occidentalis]|uniref:3 beta-hydroxysteroid dehydrogenase/Delta 5-->4-isomerase type 1 n=1 Tax=Galendromus occidentalis TaxID=34638 RepID=A0AAJ7SGE6_9ACAR|nr:3 beta-hydroxysteroid dehydrogenase/Delta 5-->4-isomerase type 1 [Galendromus occidentalis]
MKEIRGDLANARDVAKACEGVDCVIHCGALVDISIFPDKCALEAVNVEGTRNVINACIEQNVPYLVFTSTAYTVIGANHIFYGTETTTFKPRSFLMGSYAETKFRAEQLVLQANSRALRDGEGTLRTCVLRPTVIFGEEEKHFISRMTSVGKLYWTGTVPKIQFIDERFQLTYAGNAAYAHILAKDRLRESTECAGETFFITDDTPLDELYASIKPFVEAQEMKLSELSLPYVAVVFVLLLLSTLARIIRPIYQVGELFPTPSKITAVCMSVFFNRQKAALRLKYYPCYTPEESQERTIKYYERVKSKRHETSDT